MDMIQTRMKAKEQIECAESAIQTETEKPKCQFLTWNLGFVTTLLWSKKGTK